MDAVDFTSAQFTRLTELANDMYSPIVRKRASGNQNGTVGRYIYICTKCHAAFRVLHAVLFQYGDIEN